MNIHSTNPRAATACKSGTQYFIIAIIMCLGLIPTKGEEGIGEGKTPATLHFSFTQVEAVNAGRDIQSSDIVLAVLTEDLVWEKSAIHLALPNENSKFFKKDMHFCVLWFFNQDNEILFSKHLIRMPKESVDQILKALATLDDKKTDRDQVSKTITSVVQEVYTAYLAFKAQQEKKASPP